jgi:L-malate glycosyltransferase
VSENKINILHLQTELNLACGITKTIDQIIKYSSPKFKHYLIALGGDGLERFNSSIVNIEILSEDRNSFLGTFSILKLIYKFVKLNSIEIIHSHHRYFDFLTWCIKSVAKIKTVTSVQSKIFGRKYFSYKSDKLIACSKSIKEHLVKNFKIDQNRINLIYNSADLNEIENLKTKEEIFMALQIPFDKFIIGYVGRLDFKEKGIDILLDAIQKISKFDESIFLLLVGNGSKEKDINEFIKFSNIKAKQINSQLNIYDYYNIMDVIVLPSRVDPFPLVMLEAGLMKIPLIGGSVDGIVELIEHRKDGLLFNVGDVDDLVSQILEFIMNKKFAESLSENLYQKVLSYYTVQNIIPKYEKLYSNLLNDK